MCFDGAVREADPDVRSCLGGIGNESSLTLIESTVQNIFFYYTKSFITSEMKNDNWHFAAAINYSGDQDELE